MAFITWFLIWWVIGYLLVDWKRWREGYATVLAGSLGTFLLDSAFVSGGFWSYQDSLLPGLWPNILLNLSIYPIGAWIFIQNLPGATFGLINWILFGTITLLAVEWNLYSLGHMTYHHGWNVGYSAGVNVLLLLMLRQHHHWVNGFIQ